VNDDFIFIDNSKEILRALNSAFLKALERCGMQAEGYAKDLTPVDTGNLRNSISYRVDAASKKVVIGTNNEYATYVELGTGKYKEGGGGRPDPWVYQDDNGNWHHTHGQKAQPYLKPAVANHKQTYKNIIEDSLKNA
jgi:HK97 gp10 family phage protein